MHLCTYKSSCSFPELVARSEPQPCGDFLLTFLPSPNLSVMLMRVYWLTECCKVGEHLLHPTRRVMQHLCVRFENRGIGDGWGGFPAIQKIFLYLQKSGFVFGKVQKDRRLSCLRGVAWLVCVGHCVSDSCGAKINNQLTKPTRYATFLAVLVVFLPCFTYFSPPHLSGIPIYSCHNPSSFNTHSFCSSLTLTFLTLQLPVWRRGAIRSPAVTRSY